MKEEFIDIEKQTHTNHRESEGQDTITPLTNTLFLKQLAKLKSVTSNNSSNLSLSSLSTNSINSMKLSLTPKSSRHRSNEDLKDNLTNPFADLFSFNKTSSKMSLDKNDETLNTSLNLISNHQILSTKSGTDQVYDVISNIIHNPETNVLLIDKEFIENVKIVVIQAELLKKKKMNKSIFICRIFLFLFLFALFIMFFYFLKTLNVITANLNFTPLKCR